MREQLPCPRGPLLSRTPGDEHVRRRDPGEMQAEFARWYVPGQLTLPLRCGNEANRFAEHGARSSHQGMVLAEILAELVDQRRGHFRGDLLMDDELEQLPEGLRG